MAVAALLLWLGTAAVGTYLLVTAIQSGRAAEPQPQAAEPVPAAAAAGGAGPAARVRARDRFDPPSLQRSKSEDLPGLRDLAEFAHPALAFIGFGFWFGYVVSRDQVFAAIGLGILLGAIAAGLSWFTVNHRAAKRTAAAALENPDGSPGEAGVTGPGGAPLIASPRLLVLHAVGAVATLLFVALIAARV